MKQGKTLSELASELDRQAREKKDFIVQANKMSLEQDLSAKFGAYRYPVTTTFHEQLGGELGIPKKYYDRMLKDSPDLLITNVNHWLEGSDARRMIRTLDGNARAYLSDKYRPLDHYDLLEVAIPELQKAGCRVESCEVTESRLYIKAVTERITFEVKQGDIVQAGIVISNSEIGYGALKIEGLLFRLACLNGMILPEAGLRKSHVARGSAFDFEGATEYYRTETRVADDKAFWLKVRDTVGGALTQINFERAARKFTDAQQDKIEKPVDDVIEVAQSRFGWSDTERGTVFGHLMAAGELTRFGLANAITRTAQDLPSYDRATEFERLGGQVIELPRNDWQRMAA